QVDHFQPRFGRQGRPLGALDQPLVDLAGDLGLGVANVVEGLGEVGHDVGGAAAVGDDVVDAGEVGRVLAQERRRVVGEGDGPQGGAALFGRGGGVGAGAVEAELDRQARQVRARAGEVAAGGVPVEHDVAVLEQAGADH